MKDLSAVTVGNVRAAARLYDELGEREFLARYGFGRSKKYQLNVDGSLYPSKAILGVAHEFATGAALNRVNLTGGLQSTVRVLERLGFEIVSDASAASINEEAQAHEMYLLLWNPKGFDWDDADRLEILDATLDGESLAHQWSIYSNRKRIAIGDRVFLRKTGRDAPGILASGWVTSEVFIAEHWDPSRTDETYFVNVVWDAMVDIHDTLDLTALAGEFPHSAWTAAGGGALVPEDAAVELEREWVRYLNALTAPDSAAVEGQDPYRIRIVREYAEALVRRRRHQRAFRALLLASRDHRCAYRECGIDEQKVLEAAHIVPDSEGGEPSLENGLLLCRNHHRALDAQLLGFDGNEFHWAPGTTQF